MTTKISSTKNENEFPLLPDQRNWRSPRTESSTYVKVHANQQQQPRKILERFDQHHYTHCPMPCYTPHHHTLMGASPHSFSSAACHCSSPSLSPSIHPRCYILKCSLHLLLSSSSSSVAANKVVKRMHHNISLAPSARHTFIGHHASSYTGLAYYYYNNMYMYNCCIIIFIHPIESELPTTAVDGLLLCCLPSYYTV